MKDIWAIGDIHGCLTELTEIVSEINKRSLLSPQIIMIGDYIDRGPDSYGVIRYIMGLKDKMGADLILLKGNHEQMLIEAYDSVNGSMMASWLSNGGVATHRSFGCDYLDIPTTPEFKFLQNELKLIYESEYNIFVHAGLNPAYPLHQQKEDEMLWIRGGPDYNWGKIVIHGHTAVKDITERLFSINIDTACVFGGKLTAIRLNDEGGISEKIQIESSVDRWRP